MKAFVVAVMSVATLSACKGSSSAAADAAASAAPSASTVATASAATKETPEAAFRKKLADPNATSEEIDAACGAWGAAETTDVSKMVAQRACSSVSAFNHFVAAVTACAHQKPGADCSRFCANLREYTDTNQLVPGGTLKDGTKIEPLPLPASYATSEAAKVCASAKK